ncbi:hypothetical protein NBRC116590_10140 [Pelagimonas sp. KU-00592-HH]|uniref:hypothetical protein n=1 Tax=Pelagimonas sp. KU-00592-HH TaxID=3127651 RepID=UPI003101BEB6
MPEKILKIRVLLSSPGNLENDRETIKEVVEQINQDTGARAGFFIDLIRWETHTWPAAGAYAQGVINEQFPKDIDVFFGMMGSYFGTPTKEWESGTEEEFRIAYKSWKQTGSPEIMFYFSDFASGLSKIDPTQLQKVADFRKEIGELGVKYETYQDTARLQIVVRRHIGSVVDQILQGTGKESLESVAQDQSYDILRNFHQLLETNPKIAQDEQARAASHHMNEHNKLLVELTKSASALTKQLSKAANRLTSAHRTNNVQEMETAAQIAITALDRYKGALIDFIPTLEERMRSSLVSFQRCLEIVYSSGLQSELPLDAALIPLSELKSAYICARDTTADMTCGLQEIDYGSGDLGIQKACIISLHQDLLAYFDRSISLMDEFHKYVPQ